MAAEGAEVERQNFVSDLVAKLRQEVFEQIVSAYPPDAGSELKAHIDRLLPAPADDQDGLQAKSLLEQSRKILLEFESDSKEEQEAIQQLGWEVDDVLRRLAGELAG